MKKITLIGSVLLLTSMLLTGCVTKNKTDSSSAQESSESQPDTSLKLVETDPYELSANHRNMRIRGMGYSGEQYTEKTRKNEEGQKQTTYVVENVRALVVPVDFPDHPYTKYADTEDGAREELRKIMFGTRDETAWYSLSEYYKSSSHGVCNVTGDVAPWWHYESKASTIDKKNTSVSKDIAIQIQDYYRVHADEINLADYDANKDGFVDALIMIYTAPITTTGELWWAFCWSVSGAYGKYNESGNLEGINRFFWASFNFFYEKTSSTYYTSEEIKSGVAKPDSHTIIHEFGHVLSLPDYYITDYNANDYSGLGGLDMMDYNVGDHNTFSKMLYGWVNPQRVEGSSGSVTTTIRSTTTTGDAILIPAVDSWNNTYLDQYILVEFLTPEGVAELDGKVQLLGSYPLYYSKAGVRILHVDGRLGVRSRGTSSYQFTGYTYATTPPDSTSYVSFAADNTGSDSCFPDYKLIEIMPATGKSMKSRGGANAGDDCLYQAGQVFGEGNIFPGFKFNGTDGTKNKEFGFKISIDAIDGNNSATITISRA